MTQDDCLGLMFPFKVRQDDCLGRVCPFFMDLVSAQNCTVRAILADSTCDIVGITTNVHETVRWVPAVV